MPQRRATLLTRSGALIWLLVLVAAGIWLATRFAAGPVINADLLSLLPAAQQEPAIRAAAESVQEAAERKLVILVSAEESAGAREAAAMVSERLAGTGHFTRLDLQQEAGAMRQLGALYFPYRFGLLSDDARQELLAGDRTAFERRVVSRYLNPLGGLSSSLVEADPLLLLPDFLTSLAPRAAWRLRSEDGFLAIEDDGAFHVLLQAELAASPFSMSLQDSLAPVLEDLRRELAESYGGSTLTMAGVFSHAAAGTASARREVSTIGLGSLAGILLLFIATFRSLRPFFMGAAAVAFGCLAGLAACLALFGQVHLMTLVFGASLVGISIDYAIHYFCEDAAAGGTGASREALHRVFPSITLGLVTSITGFACIFLAPFPGLREMAVFSGAGLTGAWLTIVLFYPLLPQRATGDGRRALRWAERYGRLWRLDRKRGLLAGLILVLLVAGIGCARLVPLDDFRLLQAGVPEVLAEEARVRELLGQDHASQFFLVRADEPGNVLRREEALIADLRPLLDSGDLGGITALSRFVPSPARQKENRALLARRFASEGRALQALEETLGLPDSTVGAFAAQLRETGDQATLGLQDWLESPASVPFRSLWVEGEEGPASVIALAGVRDTEPLRRIAEAHPDVAFIDRVDDLSQVFTSYRSKTLWLTAAAYIAVTLFLSLRYGAQGALCVIAVPLSAAVISFGALGYLSEPISLFNVMALLLLLGVGIDYGIYFREAGRVRPHTLLAVALSALTTVLAFGLLALSATAAVHSFGLTLLIGITAAFFLSPLAALLVPSPPPKNAIGELP
jgi:predicted exporter